MEFEIRFKSASDEMIIAMRRSYGRIKADGSIKQEDKEKILSLPVNEIFIGVSNTGKEYGIKRIC